MKYSEAINIVDRLTPNEYTTDDKLRWLHLLDMQIFNELIMQREHKMCVPKSPCMDDALLVPEPYSEDVYINFLQARICKENMEFNKYNSFITLYNDGYNRFAAYYCSHHRSLPACTFFDI